MNQPAIELVGVTKRYGDFTAVRGIDMEVPTGATYGLLGPNGAGKTTTIRMILRIIEESEGEIRVLGRPVDRGVLDRVGYLPEERGVYKRMTVRRLLTFLASLKGVTGREVHRRMDRWLERFDLSPWRDAKVEELSKGMQQKLQFIATVLHEPDLVILDEPFSGLDPINQKVLRDIIAELRREGRTVLFSTHIIEHAERICDHVCIIARGRKAVDGPMRRVRHEHGERYVAVAAADGAGLSDLLEASPIVRAVRQDGVRQGQGNVAMVTLAPGADPQELLGELVRNEVRLTRFELVEPSLEQVFIDHVGGRPDAVEVEGEVAHV